jgi:hypothetical protein
MALQRRAYGAIIHPDLPNRAFRVEAQPIAVTAAQKSFSSRSI